MSGWLLAFGITLALEVPLVALCFPGQRGRMALITALATTVTHVLLHFGLPLLLPSWPWSQIVLLGEVLATALEALAYALLSRPREPGRALVASGLANAASFGAGLLLFGGL